MLPLLALVGLGYGVYYFMTHRQAGSSKPIDVSNIPGALTPISAPSLVKGPKSGTTWLVQIVGQDSGHIVFDVILNDPNVPARPHMVIRYAQSVQNPTVRTLVAVGNTDPNLVAKAKADFGIEERQPASTALSPS